MAVSRGNGPWLRDAVVFPLPFCVSCLLCLLRLRSRVDLGRRLAGYSFCTDQRNKSFHSAQYISFSKAKNLHGQSVSVQIMIMDKSHTGADPKPSR